MNSQYRLFSWIAITRWAFVVKFFLNRDTGMAETNTATICLKTKGESIGI